MFNQKKESRAVSDILLDFIETHPENEITVGQMVAAFGERAFGFLTLVFALICVVPLPIPGIHMILAVPLFYLSLQQMIGRRQVWFPQRVLHYGIPRRALTNISLKAIPWIRKVESISRPRLSFLTNRFFFCFFGAMIFYITAFLSIPLPLTNLVPALAIVLMALGLLNRDGLALLAGTSVGIVWSLAWFYIFWKTFMFLVHQLTEPAIRYLCAHHPDLSYCS